VLDGVHDGHRGVGLRAAGRDHDVEEVPTERELQYLLLLERH
jgi:hypothetical protein